MKDLQEATERICELKGGLVALNALVPAVIDALGAPSRARLVQSFDAYAEAARTVMLHTDISDVVLATFERDVTRNRALLQRSGRPEPSETPTGAVEALLFTTTRVTTHAQANVLTSASGFFFRRADRLFLISNRHVFEDAPSAHFPDRIEIGVHTHAQDLTQHAIVSLPLYREGVKQWRESSDMVGGAVDVAALEIPVGQLPADATLQAFDESHLKAEGEKVDIGDALTIVGFPLGFHDTVHHLPVARGASVASAFGIRFQTEAFFLTDARTHSGSSGSPVVMRRRIPEGSPRPLIPWQLLGVHSSRMDMRTRDRAQDESLGLNCAWYASVLLALTTGDGEAP